MKHTIRLLAMLLTLVMLLSAMPLTASAADGVRTIDTATLTTLNNRITGYENKINNNSSNAYVNMQDAYNKYTYAMAVKDVANYGSLTDQTAVNTAASDLYTAYNTNLKAWSAYTANGPVKYGNVTKQPSSYSNILYAYDNTSTNYSGSGIKSESSTAGVTYGGYFWFYTPSNFTIMYDGKTTPKIPMMLGVLDKDKNYNIHPRYIRIDTADFSLTDYWYGYDDNFGWPASTSKRVGYSTSTARSYSDGDHLEIDNESTYRSLRNFLYYNGTPSNTLTTQSGLSFYESHDMRIGWGWAGYTATSEEKHHTPSNVIRIINYKKLIDKVSDKKSLWTTTAKQAVNGNYREGGFSGFMGSLDTINFDPNSFFTSSNNYNGCVTAIDTAVSALDSPAARTADSHQTAYEALRTAEMQNDGTKGTARAVYAAGNTKWTTSSWAPFKAAFEAVMDEFDSVVNTSNKSFSYTLTDATTLVDNLNTAYAGLKERADFSEVEADKDNTDYQDARASQDYTTSTHNAFTAAYQTATDYANLDNATKLDTEKAVEQDSIDAAHNDTATTYAALDLKADFTAIDADKNTQAYYSVSATNYTYDTYKAFVTARHEIDTYAAYDAATRADTGRNAKQAALDQADTDIRTAWNNLAPVDAADKYDNFDEVVATVQGELQQTGKYSAAAIQSIQSILTQQQAAVYHTVTADEADLLGVTAGTKLKNTTTDATDTVTAALLTAVNTITQSSTNYNTYNVSFTAEKDGEQIIEQTATVPYGTVYTFDLGNNFDEDNNTVVWSATTNDGTAVTGSNKMNGRGTIDKLIDTNIAVHAIITGYTAGVLYTYKIYNGNGRLVSIEHHATNDVKEFNDAKALVAIPFYTFDSWYIEVDENTKTVTVKAAYAAGDPIHYTVVSGTITDDKNENKGAAADLIYDRETKVTYTGSNSFYAWAVKVGSKYTVVSYNSTYTFYSHTALDFVPIIKDVDTYKFETAEGNFAVTADMIASSSANTFGLTADEYVKTKLDNKAPFIAVVGTKILNNEKTRAFAMVTEGCTTPYSGVGMKFSKAGDDPIDETAKAIPTVVSTGQFSVTLSGTTIGKFRATVNYDFPYTQAGGTAHLDVTDVSDLA